MWKPLEKLVGFMSKPLEHWQARKTLTAEAKQARDTLKVEQRFELEKLDHQAKVATATGKLRMAEQGQQQDHDLDRIAMENMRNSWKDELVLIIFIVPIILAFIPNMQPHVAAGFDAIAKMPSWYIGLLVGMVVVIYGLRGLLKAYLNRSFTLPNVAPKTPKVAANTVATKSTHPNIRPAE